MLQKPNETSTTISFIPYAVTNIIGESVSNPEEIVTFGRITESRKKLSRKVVRADQIKKRKGKLTFKKIGSIRL